MDVVLPKVALTMTEATMVEWFKKEGETISKGELLFSMETDKTELEVESPGDGILRDVKYGPGDTVQAGAVVAKIEDGGAQTQQKGSASSEPNVAPSAAGLAEELGVDIGTVMGTGTGGRILEADVIKAASGSKHPSDNGATQSSEPVSHVEVAKFSRARAAGMRLTEHATKVPTFLLSGLVDFHPRWSEMSSASVSVTDVLALASAAALRDVPVANARYRDGQVERYLEPRVGILVRQNDALVPLVFDAPAQLDASSFRAQRTEAAQALEEGKLPLKRMSGATFVISNLGRYNVDFFSAVLFPDTAITMATGTMGVVPDRPRALRAVLTCDHRIVDGVDAAEFLQAVQQRVADIRLNSEEGKIP
jgi:pyruvate dehydrogenase E2 component (dihydrolipoamide acetyltransferase)